jgi:hypothetical protein
MEIDLNDRNWWRRFQVKLPAGKVGSHKVETFDVDRLAARDFNMSLLEDAPVHERLGYTDRRIWPGTYTRLVHPIRGVVMSDTPAEIADHLEFIVRAKGRVLIHGLGIGMCAAAILSKAEVGHVLVVEKDEDVIELVAPTLRERYGDRIEIVQGDAYHWRRKPGQMWECAWHDIWDMISPDNLKPMKKLVKRFENRAIWQGCWLEEQTVKFDELHREAKAAGY